MGEVKQFSRTDVKGRDGRNGSPLWLVIRDSVYDVTAYINEHPGGEDPFFEHAGRDATRDFDAVGHSQDARSVMAKYKIGEVVEEEKEYDANGKKKKKRVVSAQAQPDTESRSCLGIVTCGLLG